MEQSVNKRCFKTLVDYFLHHSLYRPSQTAVVDAVDSMTYRELDERSACLAQYLISLGVRRDEFVCVSLPRRKEFIISVLAIMRAGAAYVPVDLSYPEKRRQYMIKDSDARIVITEEFLANVDLTAKVQGVNCSTPESIAYMIYTSGSTGKPKGVVTKQKSISALLAWSISEFFYIKESDRYLSTSNFSFVASVLDLLCPLASGACVHILEEDLRHDLNGLYQYIISHDINRVFTSTSLGSALINNYPDLKLDFIQMAGEKMMPLRRTSTRIINIYGSTETCSFVTYHIVDQEKDGSVPIGRSVPGIQIFICDENGMPVPQGEEGELLLCGEQLCEGYWKQEELTSLKFISSPLAPGKKLYRTGDRVRLNTDGEIEYIGRVDDQVKIRGFRVELGEIENTAAIYNGIISSAAAVCHSRLVLYYTSDTQVDESSLKEFLSSHLADYMVPAVYMRLDTIPLTPNGKKNRRMLPVPVINDEIVAPENETEKKISDIVASMLDSSDFGVTTNLISVGLDSLTAMTLSVKLSRELGAEIKALQILQAPDIRSIAAGISGTASRTLYPKRESYPLSENQKALYLEWELNPDSTKYNLPTLLKFDNVAADDLRNALIRTVNAHPALKRMFTIENGELVQIRRDDAEVVVEVYDYEPSASELIEPFVLLDSPLYRFKIFTTSAGCSLFYDIHHTVFDGISSVIFERDIRKALKGEELAAESFSAFENALREKDWLQSAQYNDADEYFSTLLYGAEAFTYRHSTTPDTDSPASGIFRLEIEAEAVRTYCSENAFTLNSFFVTVLSELLQRFSREEKLVVSTVNNGRDTQSDDSIGMFVKTLPLVCQSSDKDTLATAVSSIQSQFLKSASYDIYPYSKVVAKLGGAPDLIFVYQGGIDSLSDDNTVSFAGESLIQALTMMVYPKGDSQFIFQIVYDTSLYALSDISTLAQSYRSFIYNCIKSNSASVKDIAIVSAEERERLISLSKGEELRYNTEETIFDMVLHNASQRPDSIAVVDSSGSFTYRDLCDRSNDLARYLLDSGVCPNDFVGICLPRTNEFLVCVLAIMRTGAAYLPMDIDYPEDRKRHVIEDSGAKLVIDEGFLKTYIRSGAKAEVNINLATPENYAYMIYTSGSTGKPKGVVVKHKSLRAYVAWMIDLFQIDHQSRHMLYSNFSFDASIQDLASPLAAGARVYVAGEDVRKNLHLLNEFIISHGITCTILTTQLGMLFVNSYPDSPLKYLCIGGEKMLPVRKTDIQLINMYGPTEFTVVCTYQFVEQDRSGDIPIGRPVPNSYSFICDSKGYLLPQGVVGELALCGRQISEGYWHRPEQTDEKFVPCPFVPNQKMYRTGDLARYNEDGQLEYMGRIDHQVKIRGFRIELGEIETLAAAYSGVENAIALVKDAAIVLYYSANTVIDKDALRDFLSKSLAYYMMPACYVQLDSMPLTPNGKIDRKKLPEPMDNNTEEIAAPQNGVEEIIYKLVCRQLGTDSFGVTTNLITQGLDSLSAMSISAKLYDLEGIELPTAVMMKYHTIREWAANIESLNVSTSVQEYYPLCDNQYRLYVEWELHRDSTQYNMPSARLFSDVSADRLKTAVEAFMNTHPYLKTHFSFYEGDVVQLRMDDAPVIISADHFGNDNPEDFFQTRVRPFNLLEGPLYRLEIYSCGQGAWLFSDFHHAVFDGISYKIFYDGIKRSLQGEVLQAEKYTAFDRAVEEQKWISSNKYDEADSYFKNLLSGAAPAVFKHSLTPDSCTAGKSAKKSVTVGTGRINDFCRENGLTHNSFFLAAFASLMHRVCRENSLLFTYVDSGRDSALMYDITGMFVKTLPVVSTASGDADASFADVAFRLQKELADGISYSKYPYSKVISQLNRHPEIIFVYEGGVSTVSDDNPTLSLDIAKMPLSVIVSPVSDGGILIEFEYDSSIYNGDDIEELLECYRSFIISSTQNVRLKDISNVSPSVRKQLLELSKGEDLAYNVNETFVDMVLAAAARTPDAVAVVDCCGSLSYRELDEKSNRLALYLIEQGVRPDEFVCVSLKRRKEFVISILAVMRAGAAYVPVDLEYPADRQEYMRSDSGSRLTINGQLISEVLETGDYASDSINFSTAQSRAYMIYTSGSTGKPKGVIIGQTALRALLAWYVRMFEITPQSRHLSHVSFSFDASILDICSPLAVGATVYILSEELRTDLEGLRDYIADNRIDACTFSTQIGSLLINTYPEVPLKHICMGGEKMMPLRKSSVRIVNGYGPTEFTVASSCYVVNQETDTEIPIGRPAPNSYSFICDSYGQLLPQGFAGELCLAGRQIAEGYWNRPHTTSKSFVECPFMHGVRMYRTGDLARYNDAGLLEYLGRTDHQVKLRGFRIELSEIENIASLFYGIRSVAASVRNISSNVQVLCLYYTAVKDIDKEQLREFLSSKLPSYMIPDSFIQLESMPLTPNGKINTKALPSPENIKNMEGRIAKTEREWLFVNIFKSVLGLDVIYADDNFFEIGGSSLTAIRIVTAAEDAGLKITYTDVFECGSAEKLAALFDGDEKMPHVRNDYEDISQYDYSAIDNLLASNNLENFFKGRRQELGTVLLLGATGFLGIHLFHRLLVSYPDVHIVCLVRPKNGHSGVESLRSVNDYYYGSFSYEFDDDRITVIEGDVTDASISDSLLKYPIDTVINAAANIKHFSQDDDIYKANFDAVLNIIDYCKKSHARLVHISTKSVAGVFFGYQAADMQYRENRLFMGQKQISKYTQSKYLAERAILQAVAQGELSAKIMRVGNLSPRAFDGKYQMNASSNSFMSRVKASYVVGAHPIDEEYMDLELSPIDVVSEAILLLAHTPEENVVFHPFNNNQQIMGDLYDCMNDEKLYTKAVNYDEYLARLKKAKNNPELASILIGLLSYDYDSVDQIITLQIPANFTQRVLACLGFRWPVLRDSYIKQFLSSLREIGFFKLPAD